jgi:hypothetical protein
MLLLLLQLLLLLLLQLMMMTSYHSKPIFCFFFCFWFSGASEILSFDAVILSLSRKTKLLNDGGMEKENWLTGCARLCRTSDQP